MITQSLFADIIGPGLKRVFNRSFDPSGYVQVKSTARGWVITLPIILNYHSKKRINEAREDLKRELESITRLFENKIKEIRKNARTIARKSGSSKALQYGEDRSDRCDRKLVFKFSPRKNDKILGKSKSQGKRSGRFEKSKVVPGKRNTKKRG